MVLDLIGMVLYNVLLVVCLYILSGKKINLKDKNFYLGIVLLNLVSLTLANLEFPALTPWINIISLLVVDILILKNEVKKSILKIAIIYLTLLLIELILMLFIVLLCDAHNVNRLMEIMEQININEYYSLIYNFVGVFMLILFLKIKFIRNGYIRICMFIDKNFNKRAIIIVVSVFAIIFLTYQIFVLSNKVILNIIMLILLVIIISIIYFKDLKIRFEYDETKEKYLTSVHSLVEYEEMIDKYRVNNHENKNQLLTIQNMIKHKDPKVNEYIDNLVGTVYMPNEKTMMDVSIIPAGGLRATIHTKLNIMDNKKIKYILNIDRKIRTIDFDQITSDLNLKICKIMSIFIDNAIDEVDTHKKKKIVNIEMYLDEEKLIIEVSNKFNNKIDINKLYEKKYTTKTDGHGYGLPLAKELVESEPNLTNYQRIEDNIFTQVLEIKIKK